MKNTFKTNLRLSGILLGFVVLATGIYYFQKSRKYGQPTTNDTRQVTKGVYVIKDAFVNMFILKDSDHYVAIDAGNELENIRKELKSLWIDSAKVEAVLLTHSDHDHTAAISLFKNASIYLAKQEEQMINGTTARGFGSHNTLPRTDYKLLSDGQTLTIGKLRIKCILTPGHTPGSMSYLVNDSLLFVGDAFSLKNGKINRPDPEYTDDMETALKSFNKIKNLPSVQYIFTAHTRYSCEYKHAVDTVLHQ